MKSAANSAATYTKESASSIQQHYNEGTLGQAAQNKANSMGSYMKEKSNQIYQKMNN